MKKTFNFKKIAFLMVTLIAIVSCIVIPTFADNATDGSISIDEIAITETYVTEDGEELILSEYDGAMAYLDKYTTYREVDPDFETNVEIAKNTVKGETPLFASFWALVPPIIAIVLALITKEVYSSLFIGIIAGGLMAANFKPAVAMDSIIGSGLIDAVSGTAGIFVFLVVLGVMVCLINKSGGSAAFGRWASTHIKSRIGASIATFIFGVLIFIDDYFNCLTVGSVMRPITDANKISRAKLAFLIDATAAPVCMIAPISSWAAAVAGYAEEGQGLKLFIQAIPYNFYSLLTFVFIIAITLMKFDYGPMRKHEINATNGDLFTSGDKNIAESSEFEKGNEKGIILDIIFPIVVLIICCVVALVYVGNGNSFSNINFIQAFSDTDATVGLPWGALLALIISIIYYSLRKVVSFKTSMESIPAGFKAMVSAILILTLATALKNMTSLLGAKVYVAILMHNAAALQQFLPAIIFVVACVLAFATGTSWGTFGILIPIVTAIFTSDNNLMIMGISACLAGAVCGDHCSPISDTTIMSSAGAQCDHINHVSTQLPYAITVAAVSFVNFLIAPFINNVIISLAIAVVMMVAVIFAIKFFVNKKIVKA